MRALVLTLFPTLALAAGPTATLKQINGDVDKLLHQKVEPNTPAEDKQKADLKTLAGKLLDYSELAKRSLSDQWTKLTPPQRNEFVDTLRELTERNYVKQLRTNLDYKIFYTNEELKGEEATVTTTVKVKTQGKSTDAEIVYKLHKDGDRWVVWDVITDESSMVRNYQATFKKIIDEKSYDELIKKLKSKLASNP